jgi:hypothetical protein
MDDHIRQKLEVESSIGDRYAHVYESLIKPFLAKKRDELFDAFQDLPTTKPDDLLTVKLQCNALSMLDDEFKHYIQTGQLAKQALNENNEDEEDA